MEFITKNPSIILQEDVRHLVVLILTEEQRADPVGGVSDYC